MPIQMLIPIVHNYGGILGPAHPCGEKYMSFMNAKAYQRNPEILKELLRRLVGEAFRDWNTTAEELALKLTLNELQ